MGSVLRRDVVVELRSLEPPFGERRRFEAPPLDRALVVARSIVAGSIPARYSGSISVPARYFRSGSIRRGSVLPDPQPQLQVDSYVNLW